MSTLFHLVSAALLFAVEQASSANLTSPPVNEIVYPRLLGRTGADGEEVLHIKRGLILYLEKGSTEFSKYNCTDENGSVFFMSGRGLDRRLYHDSKHGSTVVVEEWYRAVRVRGIIGHNLSIEPLYPSQHSRDGMIAHKLSRVNQTRLKLPNDDDENE